MSELEKRYRDAEGDEYLFGQEDAQEKRGSVFLLLALLWVGQFFRLRTLVFVLSAVAVAVALYVSLYPGVIR